MGEPKLKLPPESPEKLARAIESYRGKWVVILGDEVLAAGNDPLSLDRWAQGRGLVYYRVSFVHDWVEFGGRPPTLIL